MITIPAEEQAIWQSSSQKNLTLAFSDGTTLDNSGICSESMELEQTVVDDANVLFGNVYSSSFRVRVFDEGKSYLGLSLRPYINIVSENGYARLTNKSGSYLTDKSGNILTVKSDTYTKKLGRYKVVSDKLSGDCIYRDLTCYDELYDVLQADYSSWHNSLTYPITLKYYRDLFFEHIGIKQIDVTLANDTIQVQKNAVKSISGSEIISSILMINACWGYIDINGRFKYVIPHSTADVTITDNSYVQGTCVFEEFVTEEFKQVTIIRNTESGEEETVNVGTGGGNVLTITDNMLLSGQTTSALQTIGNAILTQLEGFSYRPTVVTFPPYIGLELGDVFSIFTNGRSTSFPVFSRRLTGINALRDSYVSDGAELLHVNANSLENKVTSAANQASGAKISADSALSEINTMADVVDVVGWAEDYGVFTASNDDSVIPGKYYFTKAETPEEEPIVQTSSLKKARALSATASNVRATASGYVIVEEPTGNPSENGYFELDDVTQKVSQYLKTHLSLESDGLYVLMDDSGYKVRITSSSIQILNTDGTIIGEYSTTTTIGNSTENNVFIDEDSVDVRMGNTVLASFGETTVIGNTEVSEERDDDHNYITITPDDGVHFTHTFGGYDPDDSQFPSKMDYAKLYGSAETTGHGYNTYGALELSESMIASNSNDGLFLDASGTNEQMIYLIGLGGIYLNDVDYTLSESTITLWKSILGLS